MDADKEFKNFTLGITSNLDFSKPLNPLLAQRRIRQMHAHSVAGYKSNWWGRGQRPNFWTFSLHLHVGKAKNPSLVLWKHSEKAAKWSTRWRQIHSELDELEMHFTCALKEKERGNLMRSTSGLWSMDLRSKKRAYLSTIEDTYSCNCA